MCRFSSIRLIGCVLIVLSMLCSELVLLICRLVIVFFVVWCSVVWNRGWLLVIRRVGMFV